MALQTTDLEQTNSPDTWYSCDRPAACTSINQIRSADSTQAVRFFIVRQCRTRTFFPQEPPFLRPATGIIHRFLWITCGYCGLPRIVFAYFLWITPSFDLSLLICQRAKIGNDFRIFCPYRGISRCFLWTSAFVDIPKCEHPQVFHKVCHKRCG